MKTKLFIALLTLTLLGSTTTQAFDDVFPIGSDRLNPKTVKLKIKQLDQRNLANGAAKPGTIYLSLDSSYVQTKTQNATSGQDAVLSNSTTGLKSSSYSFQFCFSNMHVYDWQNFDCLHYKTEMIDKGTKELEIRLKRIDIHDMNITVVDNGEKYVIASTKAEISGFLPNDSSSPALKISINTNSGVDVPVGLRYEIKVYGDTKYDGPRAIYTTTLDYTQL